MLTINNHHLPLQPLQWQQTSFSARYKLNFYIRLQRDYEEFLNIFSSQTVTTNGQTKENGKAVLVVYRGKGKIFNSN